MSSTYSRKDRVRVDMYLKVFGCSRLRSIIEEHEASWVPVDAFGNHSKLQACYPFPTPSTFKAQYDVGAGRRTEMHAEQSEEVGSRAITPAWQIRLHGRFPHLGPSQAIRPHHRTLPVVYKSGRYARLRCFNLFSALFHPSEDLCSIMFLSSRGASSHTLHRHLEAPEAIEPAPTAETWAHLLGS